MTTVVQPTPRELASPQPDPAQQAQIDALQRQLNDLQRQSAGADAQQSSGQAPAGQHDSR